MQRRNTMQRKQVYEAIVMLGHARLDEIVTFLEDKQSSVSLASVYRNLSVLLDEGKIRMVDIANEKVYESSEQEDHFHFQCDQCGEIIDIDPRDIQLEYQDAKDLSKIHVTHVDVLFHGLCPRCGKMKN